MMFKTIIFAMVITAIAAADDRPTLRDILQLPENTPYPDDKPCTPHAHFRYYCNECTCSSDGIGASCSRMGCPPGIFEEDGTLIAPKVKREVSVGPENTPYPEDKPCTPHAQFKYYCNTCTCSSTGIGASCSRMGCPPGIFEEDGTLIAPKVKREVSVGPENTPYPEDKPCTPRAQFKYYCNTCTCSSTGIGASCSRMGCPPGIFEEDGTLIASKVKSEYIVEPENAPYPDDKPCTPNAHFKYYCNTCTCSSTGAGAECTKMGCPPGKFNEDGSLREADTSKVERENEEDSVDISSYPRDRPCAPSASFKYYCNSCMCQPNGAGAACTRMGCKPGMYNEDGSLRVPETENTAYPADKPCTPRAEFKYYCNKCTCSLNGIGASCTRMGCPPGIFNEDGSLRVANEQNVKPQTEVLELPSDGSCTPGKIYKSGCNECRCYKENLPLCTLKSCFEEPTRERSSAQNWGPYYVPGSPCEPETLFYSECNECRCRKDGKGASCTLMACDPASRPSNE